MRLAHFLGMSVWIGGAVATLVVSRVVASWTGDERARANALLAKLHGYVIAPGAIVTVVSGVLITMSMVNRGMSVAMARPGVVVMQITGIVAAVLAVFVGVPTANRLAVRATRTSPREEVPPIVMKLERRQAVVSATAGVLALIALYFGVVVR